MRLNFVPSVFALALAGTVAWSGSALAQTAQPNIASPNVGAESLRRDLMTLSEEQAGSVPLVEGRTMAVALGAIGGVVAFNLVTGGTGGLPFFASAAAAEFGPLTATGGAVAVSRVYAVTSAAVGGLLADWLYRRSVTPTGAMVPTALLHRLDPSQDIRRARYDIDGTGNTRR
ncbi:MAG: hypothetical protein AB7G39_18820 [Alphaproteobacteria bacterium]